MSFMFNPYPYDDPKAVNHIPMDEDFCSSVTQTTLATAQRIIADAAALIAEKHRCILAIDGFVSAPFTQLAGQISIQASLKKVPVTTLSTETLWMDSDLLHDKLLKYLPEDRTTDPVLLFGRLYKEGMEGLMDPEHMDVAEKKLQDFSQNGNGLLIVYGNGALISRFRPYYDLKLYMDMTQKRTILNIRSGKCGNIGIKEKSTYNEMLRHSYYVDFEASFPLRKELIQNEIVQYYLAGDHPDQIQMIDIHHLKKLFRTMVTYPLRCRPVYIEGVWGGYYVKHLRNLPEDMKAIIKLSDKQVGALANQVSYQKTEGVISVGNKSINYELKQIDFSNITSDGSTDFNIVVRLDLATVKDEMNGFPLKYLKKYVPDYFYVSSTVKINKVEDTPFAYELEHQSLTINNLDKDGTDDLFNTLDKVFKFGSAESLNLKVGETVVGALIGKEENPGFAYALRNKGASDFKFVEESGVDYFVVNI